MPLPSLMISAVWAVAVLSLVSVATATPSNEKIQVYLVPHSHDDTGWQRTVDQYFDEQVKYTYDSVIEGLAANPDRKFIFVEIAYFSRWWVQQTNTTQDFVRSLISQGRLEMVNGGWCMADEATPSLEGLLINYEAGHKFIKENLGVVPTAGYHIDPFGHAGSVPQLFAGLGYNAFIGNRIDFRLKAQWQQEVKLEFMWQTSSTSSIFTHIFDSHYSAPAGFDWEYAFSGGEGGFAPGALSNPTLVSKPTSPFVQANIAERAEDFVLEMRKRAAWFRTNNLLVPHGDDFHYQSSRPQFENIERLMDYINNNVAFGMNIQYSTISDYVQAVFDSAPMLPCYQRDFYPYAYAAAGPYSVPDVTKSMHAYWTGFFTSRPELKGTVRKAEQGYDVSSLLLAYASVLAPSVHPSQCPDPATCLDLAVDTIGVAQHHDAIVGTSLPDVVADSLMRLSTVYNLTAEAAAGAASILVTIGKSSSPPPLTSNTDAVSEALQAGKVAVVIVNNALGWYRTSPVAVPVPFANITVTSSDGNIIACQLEDENGQLSVHFLAQNVLPAGFSTFFIAPSSSSTCSSGEVPTTPIIKNGFYAISFNKTSNRTSTLTNVQTQTGMNFQQDFFEYLSSTDSNPYIFLPILGTQIAPVVPANGTVLLTLKSGPVYDEAVQVYNVNVTHVLRLYKNLPYIHSLNKIAVSNIDREIITRFSTSLFNNNAEKQPVFWTDASGLALQQRVINQTAWGINNVSEPVAGNYYPLTNSFVVQDLNSDLQLNIVTDRAHGASCLTEGAPEIMMHRRCAITDRISLDDQTTIHASLWLSTGAINNGDAFAQLRPQSIMHNQPVLLSFGQAGSVAEWSQDYATSLSAMRSPLPTSVHLQTLRATTLGGLLLRVRHIFDANEHPALSKPVVIDLAQLFTKTPSSVTEMILSGAMDLADVHRKQWHSMCPDTSTPAPQRMLEGDDLQITLDPLAIRTFLVKF